MRQHDDSPRFRGDDTLRFRGDDSARFGGHRSASPARAGKQSASSRGKPGKFDDDEPTFTKRGHRQRLEVVDDTPDAGTRWSTWDQSTPTQRGPRPHPDWLVTELAAVDLELGVLKTGKEADVFLVERAIPDTDRSCLLAAKRYRTPEHRMFHRDAGYLEGRRVRETRVNRAMAARTSFGREAIAGQWAAAEFSALCRMVEVGVPVPYPVQILGTELMLEFIGSADGGTAAPRLAQLRHDNADLTDLWRQLIEALSTMARAGFTHGDLSAYNLLVQDGHLVVIDLPQIVDVVANPHGRDFVTRDARNIAHWFANHGVTQADGDELADLLCTEAGLR